MASHLGRAYTRCEMLAGGAGGGVCSSEVAIIRTVEAVVAVTLRKAALVSPVLIVEETLKRARTKTVAWATAGDLDQCVR